MEKANCRWSRSIEILNKYGRLLRKLIITGIVLATGCLSPNGGLPIMYHWPFNIAGDNAERSERYDRDAGISKLDFNDPHLWERLNHVTSAGWTRLAYATHCGRLDVAKYLVDHGEPINQLTGGNRTALDVAIQDGYPEIASYLRSKGGLEGSQLK